jgi:creatinine amidohydrolase
MELQGQGALPVLPLGAIEQHGDHLPVDTDAFNAQEVTRLACGRLSKAQVVILPVQSFGFSMHHKTWPGTISLSAVTLTSLLVDIGQSLHRCGFRRALFVNGHGGNIGPLLSACNTMLCEGIGVGFVNYFDPGRTLWRTQLAGSKQDLGHACEYETSMQMALRPDTAEQVAARAAALPPRGDPPFAAPGPEARELIEAGMNWAWLFNPGDPGYFGDPAAAKPAQGEALLETTVGALADFIERFAKADMKVGPVD